MKFNVTALALTASLLWGGAVLLVGLGNMIWPDYGSTFLQLMASIYPGYHPGNGMGSVIAGTVYAMIDGAIGGMIFGWLYNWLAQRLGR